MGTLVLLDLMGAVALLLWGLHMVQSGILRAFGPSLRQFLSRGLGNRFAAFAAGLGLTTLLQSSTATALMTSSFAAQGLVGLVPALAILLGANVGTTLIVQVTAFNIYAVAPALFVVGLIAFRNGNRYPLKDLGRVAIGLGLVLLALRLLLETLAPTDAAPGVKTLLGAVTNDPGLCILIAAALAWAIHSSVATVLLIMSLAVSHAVTPVAAVALVLGANLGSAVNPLVEVAHGGNPASYRLPAGNFLNRAVGVAVTLLFLHPIASALAAYQPDGARMTALFHMLFNVCLAAASIGLLDPIARGLEYMFPAAKAVANNTGPRYLDEAALDTPSLALADASREVLRMGDVVEEMLRKVMRALLHNERDLVREVSRMDNDVDRLDDAIKLYVTRLMRGSLDEAESRRAMEIVSLTINLEHIGDIIDKNLSELAAKKIKRGTQFSSEGSAEIEVLQKRVRESLRRALGIFMSGNAAEARALLTEKASLKAFEIAASERHLERLKAGRPETLETTSIHLDVLRDLRRIHSHICATAYPVLEAAPSTAQGAESAAEPDLVQTKPAR